MEHREHHVDALPHHAVALEAQKPLSPDGRNGRPAVFGAASPFTGDQLAITDVYINRRGNDSLITDPAFDKLKPTGITGNRAQFQIEKLDANQMQLRSDFARIMFRKF